LAPGDERGRIASITPIAKIAKMSAIAMLGTP
jgi:hypothetical protein